MTIKTRHMIFLAATMLMSGCLQQLFPLDEGMVCNSGHNCPENYFCDLARGQCSEVGESWICSHDGECPMGSICEESLCQSGCRSDGDCGLTSACIEGECTDEVGRCNTTAMCPFGQVCNTTTQQCITPPGQGELCEHCTFRLCANHGDCPGNQLCEGATDERFGNCKSCDQGTCLESSIGDACTSARDCGAGSYCFRSGCWQDDDCPQVGGIPQSCSSERYDPDGSGFVPNTELRSCLIGVCVDSGCASECSPEVDESCPRGYSCFRNIWTPDTECSSNSDCPGASECKRVNEGSDSFYCTCTSNADCDQGTCNNGSCVVSSTCRPAVGLTCEDVK